MANLSGFDPRLMALLEAYGGQQQDAPKEETSTPFGMEAGPGLDFLRALGAPARTDFIGLPPSVSPVQAVSGDGGVVIPSQAPRPPDLSSRAAQMAALGSFGAPGSLATPMTFGAPGPAPPIALGAVPNSFLEPAVVQRAIMGDAMETGRGGADTERPSSRRETSDAPLANVAPKEGGFPDIQIHQQPSLVSAFPEMLPIQSPPSLLNGYQNQPIIQGAPQMAQMGLPGSPGAMPGAPEAKLAGLSVPEIHKLLGAAQMPGMEAMSTPNWASLMGGAGGGGGASGAGAGGGTGSGTGSGGAARAPAQGGAAGAASLIPALLRAIPALARLFPSGGLGTAGTVGGGGAPIGYGADGEPMQTNTAPEILRPNYDWERAPQDYPNEWDGSPAEPVGADFGNLVNLDFQQPIAGADFGNLINMDFGDTGIEPSTWDYTGGIEPSTWDFGGGSTDLGPFFSGSEASGGNAADVADAAGGGLGLGLGDIGAGDLGKVAGALGGAYGLGSGIAAGDPKQAIGGAAGIAGAAGVPYVNLIPALMGLGGGIASGNVAPIISGAKDLGLAGLGLSGLMAGTTAPASAAASAAVGGGIAGGAAGGVAAAGVMAPIAIGATILANVLIDELMDPKGKVSAVQDANYLASQGLPQQAGVLKAGASLLPMINDKLTDEQAWNMFNLARAGVKASQLMSDPMAHQGQRDSGAQYANLPGLAGMVEKDAPAALLATIRLQDLLTSRGYKAEDFKVPEVGTGALAGQPDSPFARFYGTPATVGDNAPGAPWMTPEQIQFEQTAFPGGRDGGSLYLDPAQALGDIGHYGGFTEVPYGETAEGRAAMQQAMTDEFRQTGAIDPAHAQQWETQQYAPATMAAIGGEGTLEERLHRYLSTLPGYAGSAMSQVWG